MPVFDFILAGRYRLLAPLGEGGMASVYRARDLRLNREVAVKILREDLTRDPEFLSRFEREAQFVASLSHPNIVPVYDVGDEQGTRFIVMEYIRGRTLRDALDANGPFPADRAILIIQAVLAALAYAHARGLIHRDVKPQNILLAADGTPRLADFGIAHLAGASYTRTAAILGSAHYLSPEQSRGEEATIASDIYACGIVLHEMLTGKPPFDGPNALAIAHHHLSSDPPPLPPDVPAGIADAVSRALAKDPVDRFQDASEFSAELEASQTDLSATITQPLQVGHTEKLPRDSSGSRPLPRPEPGSGDRLLLRRSPRKTIVLFTLCAALLAGAAILAQTPIDGYSLPSYPSAPYAACPAALLALFALWWFHIRSWRYQMDGNAAVLQWGLLSHHRFGVPVQHITTLELKQSPIDRVLGLGTVELCARDQHGDERRLVLEDLPHPRQTYDDLLHFLGRALRRVPPIAP